MWVLKLVRKFETDPNEVRRLQAYGDPTPEQLNRAREYTQRMRERGELRSRSPHRCVPPAIELAMRRFVRERFAQGWSKSRLARGFSLDRRTVKRILDSAKDLHVTWRRQRAAVKAEKWQRRPTA
jgi:DNA invertase Pin-like site-specific DNA recombinase